jgi:hypothetical protein
MIIVENGQSRAILRVCDNWSEIISQAQNHSKVFVIAIAG